MTQIENATEMMGDILKSLPTPPPLESEEESKEENPEGEEASSGDSEEE